VFLATHLQIGALMWAGDFVSARRESSELLRLASASDLRGKLGFEVIALEHLGQLDLREGHLSEAEARVREALALHEKRRDLRQSADCFKTLSSISERKGDYKAALHWERRSSDAFARFASASAHAHASAMEVREGAARARESAALQKERADRLELTNVELAREAHEDVLTGIANRRGLDTKLTELFADRRGGRRCSLALLDVDHFKQVNDTFLHTTGDKVLARLGAVLRECSREKDVVARFGGEEFAVALVDIDPAEAGAACERIRAAVAGAAWSELHPDLLVTVSVGFAHFSEAGEGVADLVKLTDARLFDAKRAGRNRVVGPGETG
jgi:diguanylate cyclase (GGDEF)-like protein